MNVKTLLPANSIFSGRNLNPGERVTIAMPIALAAGLAAYLAFQRVPDMIARDFTYPWWGAGALLEGKNPYEVIKPVGPAPYDHWFMYPLTAPIAVVPLARLPAQLAGAIFSALSAGVLAFFLTRSGGLPSLLMLLSPSFGFAVVLGQWSPILVAAAFAAPIGWLLVCKPTIGLPLFLYRPKWLTAIGCMFFLVVSLLVLPTWPRDWLRNTQALGGHFVPLLRPFGFLCALCVIRWRRAEARLVATMSMVPQNLYFYDQLPLYLAATTTRRTIFLLGLSWGAWWLGRIGCENPQFCGQESEVWVILLMYLPATLMALCDDAELRTYRNRARAVFGGWRRRKETQE